MTFWLTKIELKGPRNIKQLTLVEVHFFYVKNKPFNPELVDS